MEETAAAAAPVPNAATPEPAGDAPSGDASADPAAVGDDEHDSKEVVLRRYFLQEWELVSAILRRIVAAGGDAEPADVHKIRSIMDKYQEEGQLLEPYLENIVLPLMSLVRSKTMELGTGTDELLDIIKPLCIIIYTLVTVCGYKSVIKFFPHQVSDLELGVALLEKCHTISSVTALRQESTGEMETKCVVLLWLYILVLIPFDISTVDTSIATADSVDGAEVVPLVTRILNICKDYLSSSGPMRRISGLLLARLLTRPDMAKAFSSFMEWANEMLLSVTDDFVDQFRSIGIVEALVSIFKIGNRRALYDTVSGAWNDCSVVMKTNVSARSPLLRKFLVKLAQRIALISLPPRSPSWRYKSISNSLGANLSSSTTGEAYSSESSEQVNIDQTDVCLLEDMDVPEIVEEIIDLLLTGLRDSDTIVRWSSAKGIGRITARLTPALSEEVISSILQLFSPGEGDGSWHGGCLALAELARRGLLLPSSFPDVIPVIIKALHYDVRRGPHSIGSHVRDAAAYVCWAFGRAYTNCDMKAVLEQLAPHLLTVACYDREVNCRRAASAAFQENVGRQGTFPHGIDIVNTTDYFALASRSNSYLNVAVSVAQYKKYLYPFADELLCNKITHWEKSLRELAAQALSLLVQYDMDYFGGHALEKLVPCTLSSDLCTRHGATLAAGEVALRLYQLGFTFSTDMQKALSGIVPAIEKARLYRGKGGEIMRSAVSRFISCISIAGISLNEKIKKSLLETLNDNLRHPNAQIQVPTVSYPRLVKLLQVSCYSKSVLSGLVISTGGLQESLKKASTSALVGYLEDSDINTNCEGKSREHLLSCDLLWVLQCYQKCDRVITPTLKTIEALFSKKVFLTREGYSEFYSGLVDSVGSELKGSKDFTKLCAGLSILGYISSQLDGTCTKAFTQLLTFLGHRYPKIRKAAADQVYLVLLQNDDLIPSENMDKAQELLAETCWEGDLEEARRKRSQINKMAGFSVATSLKSENQETRITDARNIVTTDENKSYSSLVDFSGY
ncbi:hypothetical protein PVAP13_9KG142400 [Panicum virgatum]|uniref:Tubulin-specific chaperone D n=1 Tax=Panicum virgatum TaxID=38727 RepID=A0A8T0NGP7_PANVG|nr:hypothetical protein PVAP13_9KG142400 [Panicum virgatum]